MNRIMEKEKEQDIKDLANNYLYLINVAEMDERYVESKYLELLWSKSGREVRHVVEDILHLYLAGYLPKLIVGTRYGYIYTNNSEIIGPFLEKKERHWKSECINCYYLQKRFRNKNNMTLKDYLEI